MAGTTKGAKKAAQTNKAKYGKDFYARIGTMGEKLGTTGGFYANRELAAEAGRKGGFVSRLPKGYKVSSETKAKQRAAWAARKQAKIFVADTTEFSEGFNRPSKFKQLMDRMMK